MTDAAYQWLERVLPSGSHPALTPLKAEASFRSFFRVSREGESWILMISPPEREQNERFESLATLFHSAGLPVPEILERNSRQGWYLLSDLGPRDLEAAYAGADREAALTAAIDTLVRLQKVRDPAIEPYTEERFRTELGIFAEWLVSAALDSSVPRSVAPVFDLLVERAVRQIQCCVHRDYHCRNLLFNDQRLGIVDFQDALEGPISYDLASLLHDCYYRFEDAEVERWARYFLAINPVPLDPAAFRVDLDYIAIQRQLKAVGIFARLRLRDGKSTHLAHIAPVLEHLRVLSGRHAELAPLHQWLMDLDDRRALKFLESESEE